MKESKSNIWNSNANYICVTTNGVVKRNGALVMGAGIAKQARDGYPGIDMHLGNVVKLHGNIPHMYNMGTNQPIIISLPTKHHWKDKSDLNLIIESIYNITGMIPPNSKVALTRPGCALGGLNWENTVKPAIEPMLNDQFTVYHL